MSGNVKDLRITTMQAITKALVNGSWGQYPCAMATEGTNNEVIVAQCNKLQSIIDRMTEEHKAELAEVRQAERKKVDHLQKQIAFEESQIVAKDKLLEERYEFIKRKDKIIALLGSLLAVTLFVIITGLVIDSFNPNIGFFWLNP